MIEKYCNEVSELLSKKDDVAVIEKYDAIESFEIS
ncbi:hypothetical protein LCGC14_2689440 [marine sediment metagenome]|uniref:Uncharacterized protein n=1 Tax=marine sediment metagenome TaxID=412755 RepID=A0A0F8ZIX9_9ZZZZ